MIPLDMLLCKTTRIDLSKEYKKIAKSQRGFGLTLSQKFNMLEKN